MMRGRFHKSVVAISTKEGIKAFFTFFVLDFILH